MQPSACDVDTSTESAQNSEVDTEESEQEALGSDNGSMRTYLERMREINYIKDSMCNLLTMHSRSLGNEGETDTCVVN
ncbi:unnamed protein product [Allacma fusca]|uniref:Uncharacterized protein n=1 Tax=Allacma fusca TaxID=39272 RepID=A0A8J2NUC8_9HEXA|nr:unnamed protein product [Allacma fusca]